MGGLPGLSVCRPCLHGYGNLHQRTILSDSSLIPSRRSATWGKGRQRSLYAPNASQCPGRHHDASRIHSGIARKPLKRERCLRQVSPDGLPLRGNHPAPLHKTPLSRRFASLNLPVGFAPLEPPARLIQPCTRSRYRGNPHSGQSTGLSAAFLTPEPKGAALATRQTTVPVF